MKIAFIGLGNMGHPMASNLLKAGHQLTVWNRSRGKANDLVASGAKVANSAREAAREAEVVFTMLSDDAAVESAVLGEEGLVNGLPRGATHVSSSTISVALSQKLHKVHAEHGQQYLAAPVFGRPEAAAKANLIVIAAGDPKVVEHCKPLFAAIGQQTFVMGTEPAMANAVKLSGNFLIASMIECLGEAVTLIRKHGVDAHRYMEMLTSTLFAAPVYKTYGGLIVNEKFEPAGFKLTLGLKDVRLALAAGEGVNVPLPVASLIRDHAIAAIANGMGDLDWSSLSQVAAKNAGLKR